MDCSMPGFPVLHYLLEFAQTHVYWVDYAIQLSHPLLSPSLPAFNLSQHQGLFQSVLRIRWSKYWSFSFSISPSNEYLGLISFRINWLVNSLLTKGVSRVFCTTIWKHQIFGTQSSLRSRFHVCNDYWKDHSILLYRPLLAKWCLCFNMMPRFVMAFLPRSKHLLISWLQFRLK